jgi:hypothetical protein
LVCWKVLSAVLLSLGQWLGTLVGLALLYMAVFLYDSETGNARNRLVDWWVSVGEARERAVASHEAFAWRMNVTMVGAIHRLWGQRLVSARAAWVSLTLSASALLFSMIVVLSTLYTTTLQFDPNPDGTSAFSIRFDRASDVSVQRWLGAFSMPGKFLVLAIAPALRWSGWRRIMVYSALVLYCSTALDLFRTSLSGILFEKQWHTATTICLPILFGALWNLAFVAIFIGAVRRYADPAKAWNATMIIFAASAVGLLLTLLPLKLAAAFKLHQFNISIALFTSLLSNVFNLLMLVGYFASMALLLLHRLLWSFVERPIYALYRVLPNRKALATVGLTCLGASTGAASQVFHAIIDGLTE